jgi:hypothetical protein
LSESESDSSESKRHWIAYAKTDAVQSLVHQPPGGQDKVQFCATGRCSQQQPRSRSLGPPQNSPEANDRTSGYISPPITNSFSDPSDESEEDDEEEEDDDDDDDGAFALRDTRIRKQESRSRSRSRKNTATSYPLRRDATENHDSQQLPTPRNLDYSAKSDDLNHNNGTTGKEDDTLAAESLRASRQLYSRLPLRPEAMPIMVVNMRGQNTPTGFREFTVRAWAMRKWLVWLKKNNPLYRDIEINEGALTQMEGDGAEVLSQFPSMFEDEVAQEGQEAGQEEGKEAEPDRGPDQGNDLEDDDNVDEDGELRLERGYLGLPILPRERITTAIAQGLEERFSEAPANYIPHNENATTLSDHSTPSLQAMAFPTLFPYGHDGDVTFQNRIKAVTMTDANAHLLKYAIKTTNGGWRYPFVEHDRWMNWAQNTCERHRVNSQKSFYIKKHPDDANMSDIITEARLKFIVNNPDRAEFNRYNRVLF